MIKQLVAICFCWLSAAHLALGQTISYDDHMGTPNAGIYEPGQSFSFDITIGLMNEFDTVGGFNLWFATAPANDGLFKIISNVFPGSSPFTEHFGILAPGGEAITANANVSDLGGTQPTPPGWSGPPGVPDDSDYFVATITLLIDPTAVPGQYSVFNSDKNGFPSSVFSGVPCPSCGFILAPFPETSYFITVVPEPATWLLCALGGSLICAQVRRRAR